VLLDPLAAGQGFVASEIHAAIGALTTIPAGGRLAEDVEHAGEFGLHPFGDAILIADVIDAESLNETGQAGSLAIMPNPPQRLRQIGLATPDRDIERALRRSGINAPNQPARCFGVVSIPDVFPAAMRIARLDAFQQCSGVRPAGASGRAT